MKLPLISLFKKKGLMKAKVTFQVKYITKYSKNKYQITTAHTEIRYISIFTISSEGKKSKLEEYNTEIKANGSFYNSLTCCKNNIWSI